MHKSCKYFLQFLFNREKKISSGIGVFLEISVLEFAGIVTGYPWPDLDTIHAKHICIRIETLFESTLRSRAMAPRAYERQPASPCV